MVVGHQREISGIADLRCMLGITKWASGNGNLGRDGETHTETRIEEEMPDEDAESPSNSDLNKKVPSCISEHNEVAG